MPKAPRARMSAEEEPTISSISPGSIFQRPASQIAICSGRRVKETRFASPGASAIRREARGEGAPLPPPRRERETAEPAQLLDGGRDARDGIVGVELDDLVARH